MFWLSAQCSAGREALALADPYRRSLQRQLGFLVAKKPPYAWGGAADPVKGLDCSGYLYVAVRQAAIPGVTRTTALRMSSGAGGWIGRDVHPEEAQSCDLAFWTFNPTRPNGHVGAFLRTTDNELGVTHASPARGVVLERLTGRLNTCLTKIRRLTIGD